MPKLKYILALVCFACSQKSYAFDDDRKGFMLGFGLGIHKFDLDMNNQSTSNSAETRVATSFRIGGGITNQFMLYYIRNTSWFNASYSDGINNSDIFYVSGLSGLGATYYFQESTPSA